MAPAAIAQRVPADELMAWLRGRQGLEAVIHMGAVTSTTETDADLILRTNVWLPLMLWDWCARARVPLIWASSAQVYGDGGQGFDDSCCQQDMARLRPVTPYGASKLLFDRLAVRERDAGRPTPPHWAGLRFFNVYGPFEDHKGDMRSPIAKNFPLLRAGGALRLFRSHRPGIADGEQKRDYRRARGGQNGGRCSSGISKPSSSAFLSAMLCKRLSAKNASALTIMRDAQNAA